MKIKKRKKKRRKAGNIKCPEPETAVRALGADCYDPDYPDLKLGKAARRHIKSTWSLK